MVGAGKLPRSKDHDLLKLGGAAAGKFSAGADAVTVFAELPGGAMKPEQAAAMASGMRLRAYKFDRYKTKKKDDEQDADARRLCRSRSPTSPRAQKAFSPESQSSTASSSRATSSTSRRTCSIRRNSRAAPAQLSKLGVEVEVLDEKAMTKLGMGALLGVGAGLGAARPHW